MWNLGSVFGSRAMGSRLVVNHRSLIAVGIQGYAPEHDARWRRILGGYGSILSFMAFSSLIENDTMQSLSWIGVGLIALGWGFLMMQHLDDDDGVFEEAVIPQQSAPVVASQEEVRFEIPEPVLSSEEDESVEEVDVLVEEVDEPVEEVDEPVDEIEPVFKKKAVARRLKDNQKQSNLSPCRCLQTSKPRTDLRYDFLRANSKRFSSRLLQPLTMATSQL